jgi:Domain of unknown function (DUF5348)
MSTNATIYTLVASTNRGRYCLDDPECGHDLTSGEPIALLLGGHWIEGRIEHSTMYDQPGCYHSADDGKHHQPAHEAAVQDPVESAMRQPLDLFYGYYFIARDDTVCGLFTGMYVRLR